MSKEQAEAHQRKHGFLPMMSLKEAKQIIKNVNRPRMTKTESEYALMLEAMKRHGEILDYEYEGITLRWQVGDELIRYTPDFVVFLDVVGSCWPKLKFIEVKGGASIKSNIYERTIERFRHARTRWPHFGFEMHQKKQGQWSRIH